MPAKTLTIRLIPLALMALLLTSCGKQLSDFTVETGPTVTETQTVQSLGAQAADVEIKLGVGKLTVAGGATDLMTGTFTYNVPTWKPEVEYELTGNRGRLRVAQPGATEGNIPTSPNVDYEWDLHFSDWMPIALVADLGVGSGELNLRGMNLTDLSVTTGVGSSTIDLGGNWNSSFNVRVRRGVGKTTLIVPTQVGVQISPRNGLGNVQVYGLVQDGDVYHNSLYGVSPVTVDIEIFGGVGETEIRQDQ
ncbi:MAG: toast rack family protein [Chloroflexota bacterium]